MAKYSAPGCKGKSGPLSHPSRKVKTAKGLSRNDLCALRLLFVHPLVFLPGGSKRKEESMSTKGFVFFSLPKKSSAISAYSAVDFFFLLEGRRDFYDFLSNKIDMDFGHFRQNPCLVIET
jgi:hypothetical protein